MRFGLDLPPHYRVFGAFFIYSFGLGGFFPRLAEIQAQLKVGQGEFGLALIGTAVGTLISLTFAAPLVERLGHRSVIALVSILPVIYAAASFAPASCKASMVPKVLASSAAVVSPTWRMPSAKMNRSSEISRRASIAANRLRTEVSP